jgi:hypothetical protein
MCLSRISQRPTAQVQGGYPLTPHQDIDLAWHPESGSFLQITQLLFDPIPAPLSHWNDFRIWHGWSLTSISSHHSISSALVGNQL